MDIANTVIELQHDPERPATRTFVDKQGNTNTMRTSGIGRRPEPEPDYSLREDPRQLDIEQVAFDDAEEAWLEMHRENPPAGPEFVYHADAARFRGQLCEMIDTLTSPRWRCVSHAINAWMKGRAAALCRLVCSARLTSWVLRLRCSRCGSRQVGIVVQPGARPPAVRESEKRAY